MKWLLALLISPVFGARVSAATFTGRAPPNKSEVIEFVDTVKEYDKADHDLRIAFSRHAAFYRFALSGEIETQLRHYLDAAKKQRAALRITVDPWTARIWKINSVR